MKIRTTILSVALLVFSALCPLASWAADDSSAGKSSSMQIMERAEIIVYGEPGKGGLIERLNSLETELFGRALPGSISERHSAILNFLEIGMPEQPSMLFKLGVADWIVGQTSQARNAALPRVEILETDLNGAMEYGKPLAMRVQRLLETLVADPVTSEEVLLPNATVLKLQFLDELGPATTKKGDLVNLALIDDLRVGNVLVAPKGSLIDTVVSKVSQPRNFGIPSDIDFEFKSLMPLGPQRPKVFHGEVSKTATKEAQKGLDRGAPGILGAVGAGVGGLALLGPIGLPVAVLVRGNAVKIPAGTIMFLETSGDVTVSGYPIPESLRLDPNATIQEATISTSGSDSDIDTIQLPAEQTIN